MADLLPVITEGRLEAPRGRFVEWGFPEDGSPRVCWQHIDEISPDAREQLASRLALEDVELDALFDDLTRPRFASFEHGDLLVVRGLNEADPDAPEGLVSLRLWIDDAGVYSFTQMPAPFVEGVFARLIRGGGIGEPGELVVRLLNAATEPIKQSVADLEQRVDDFEDEIGDDDSVDLSEALPGMRRKLIWLRRFLVPQLDAIEEILTEPPPWCSADIAVQIGEVRNRTARLIELINTLREHLAILGERLHMQLSERMHRTSYRLTVIAAIFLPLNFLAALLGVNLGGIPGAENPVAFLALCIGMTVIGVGAVGLLKYLKWF